MNNTTNETKTKVCTKCERELPATLEYFRKKKEGKNGLEASCKECRGSKFGVRFIRKNMNPKEGHDFCTKCHRELPLDSNHFYKHKQSKTGWGSWCKECWGGSFGVHQINKTFKAKEGYKYCASCERELPYVSFSKTRENSDGYDSSCKSCQSTRHKEYQSRPEIKIKRAEYQKVWRKKYYATEAGKAMNAKHINLRRSRKANTVYNYSNDIWKETLEHFNHECAYCGKPEKGLNQEHVIPLSKDGHYTKQNIIPACQFCNTSKKDKNLMDWYPTKEYFSEKRLKKINRWTGIKNNSQQLSIF